MIPIGSASDPPNRLRRPHRPRRVARGRVRVAGGLALLAALASVAPPSRAQQDSVLTEKGGKKTKARALAVVGLLVGGAAGYALGATQKPTNYSVVVAGAVIGGVTGWLVGRQYDELHAVQFRGVQPISPRTVDVDLEGEPTALAVNDSRVAVAGSEGVQIFASGASLIPTNSRAAGLLGIVAVDLAPRTQFLALGSGVGLYLFPPRQGRGVLVSEGGVAAVAASEGRVFFASGSRVAVAPVDADSTARWPGLVLGAPLRALAFDAARAILWAATDERLVALRVMGDSLAIIGSAAIDGAARRVAALGDRVAVAVGTGGVRVFDVSDPTRPRAGRPWTVARFAYDVSLDGSRMFVAAGPEGVYVVEFRHGSMITIGLARKLGFASAILSRGGYTYLLDRRTNELRRLESAF